MIFENNLREVIQKVQDFIIQEDYKGYDPYDVLNSPLFKLPLLRRNKTIRFLSQQIFRRIPFNIRPILGIKKEINPVTLGLCIQAYTYLSNVYYHNKSFYLNEIKKLINMLIELCSKGYSGYCWGYNFDWEARYASIPKYMPTVVATGIITNGLFEYYKFYKDKLVEDILVSSSNFVLKDLNRSYEGDTFCFSYSTNDYQKVYNATMKGARLLAQVYSITKDSELKKEAENTVKFVINNQNSDGSWYYSKGDNRNWVDNFHTAYVLDSLKCYIELTESYNYINYLEKGFDFYFNNLFTTDYIPKYYSNSFYPIDATELAQSIITLSNFGKMDIAKKIILFAIENLYSGNSYFYYRKNKILDKNNYIRWSNSWFLVAFSMWMLKKFEGNNALV